MAAHPYALGLVIVLAFGCDAPEDVCSTLDSSECDASEECLFEAGADTCLQRCEAGCPDGTVCEVDSSIDHCVDGEECLSFILAADVCRED